MMELNGQIVVEIFKTEGYKDPRNHKPVYLKIFNCSKLAITAIIYEMSDLLNIDGQPDEIVWNEFKTRKELKEVTAGLDYYAVVKCIEPYDDKVTTWAVYVTVDES